uniref:Uncharacterized protein n=1 Tax=uncultured marine virus TaxID=186617 RepID=A0A0F7L292_9VIRU|nr:hypothetical protein [uncultured marine virus]
MLPHLVPESSRYGPAQRDSACRVSSPRFSGWNLPPSGTCRYSGTGIDRRPRWLQWQNQSRWSWRYLPQRGWRG